VSHITILIDAVTPPPPTTAAPATDAEPQFKVSVTYQPPDAHTSAQIGNEVARVMRRVNQIIEGTAD
jgi:hypothetical protein